MSRKGSVGNLAVTATRNKTLLNLVASSPTFRKTAKGFLGAYIYVVVPRLISLSTYAIKKKQNSREYLGNILKTFYRALLPDRFPAFIGKLIALFMLANPAVKRLGFSHGKTKFISAVLSGLYCFRSYRESLRLHPKQPGTLDLSTFTLIRAADIVIRQASSVVGVPTLLRQFGDVAFFSTASFIVMFCWFYYPERLSRPYQKWITMAANMDDELVLALQELRNGNIKYGEVGPHEDLLVSMADRAGMSPEQAKFSMVDKMPCELIHSGSTKNCELHGLWRFYRGMKTAMSIYIPINLLVNGLSNRPLKEKVTRTLTGSLRSSAFLSSFIFFCWYGVCLERSRLAPLFFPKATGNQIDDTYGPALGSLLSGLSSLVERPERRGELALFVAPKALEATLPDNFDADYPHLETVAFALSFAVLASESSHARGFVGNMLRQVF